MKYFLSSAFLSIVLMLAAQSAAFAQLFCVANAAVPETVRAEGKSEALSDIVIDCTGGVPTGNGVVIPQVNFSVFLNTALTSRILSSAGNWSEALLMLDEPGVGSNPVQAPCQTANGICTNRGNGQGGATGGAPNYYVGQGSGTNVNVFQGSVSGNQVNFLGVPFDQPGSGHRIIRITNLRGDISAMGIQSLGTPVVALISVSLPINNPTQIVAFASPGLAFQARDAATVQQCHSQQNIKIGTLRYSEGFASAFKKRNILSSDAFPTVIGLQDVPGAIYGTETHFFNSSWTGDTSVRGNLKYAGLADWGTRLRASFHNVPSGVTIYVDTQGTSSTGAQDVARLTYSEDGGFSAVEADPSGPPGAAKIEVTGGEGSAVWEMTEASPASTGYIDFGVYASFTADAPAGLPPASIISVSGDLAPTGASALAVPRFTGVSTASSLLTISACPKPGFSLTATPKQKALNKKVVTVSASSEGVYSLSAAATISIAGSRKVWPLKTLNKTSVAGQSMKLQFKLRDKSLLAAIRSALARRKSVTATISVLAVDSIGIQDTKSVSVKIIR